MSTITYKEGNAGKIAVYLENKLTGYIEKESGGFRYFPIRKHKPKVKEGSGGDLFPTLSECKQSLESD